jgi:hypothetical protein
MRENRLSGSEGGGPEPKAGLPTPISTAFSLSLIMTRQALTASGQSPTMTGLERTPHGQSVPLP